MRIKCLKLKDFRNYQDLSIDFSPGVNLLFGNNAQGKTNLLEAIYLAATTKSIRGNKDKEMIRMGTEESHITLEMERDTISHKIDMHLRSNQAKSGAIDGVSIRKSSELFGYLHAISFSPDDLVMIKNGPSERRRFIDMELCQLDKIYCSKLTNYNKILQQRNNLLRQIAYNPSLRETMEVWNMQLADYGSYIIRARAEFVVELSIIVKEKMAILTKELENLTMVYEPNVSASELLDKLNSSIEKDLFQKVTTCGPHRDDINFFINDMNVRNFGSQGQQRSVVLACKLAEIELVKRKIKDLPVLLLDDVLSELDRGRQLQLLSEMNEIQTIVTCTGMEEFITDRPEENRVFLVKEGSVEQMK